MPRLNAAEVNRLRPTALDDKCAWMRREQGKKRARARMAALNAREREWRAQQKKLKPAVASVAAAGLAGPVREMPPAPFPEAAASPQEVLAAIPRRCSRDDFAAWEKIALANARSYCTRCRGSGFRLASVCNCVLRAIFVQCLHRYRFENTREKWMKKISLVPTNGRDSRMSWHMKSEDYIADFYLVSRRALADNPCGWEVFRLHFLEGLDWVACLGQLARLGHVMDRGLFFHAVYRIQQRLGRTFYELQPYSLYPIDEYFGRVIRTKTDDTVPRLASAAGSIPA